MFKHQGIYLPDGEKHFPAWMNSSGEIDKDGRGTYQIRKWRACLPWIKNWRTAADVGGHVGFWSLQMARRFALVHAFEPVEAFRECFYKNVGKDARVDAAQDVAGMEFDCRVILHDTALGATLGNVGMKIPALDGGLDTGGTHVSGPGDIEMRTLDSYEFENVDFIKIDVEGGELAVVQGAIETIKRCRPCMIIEQKAHKLGPNFGIKGIPAVDLAISLGAKQRAVLSGDYVLSFD